MGFVRATLILAIALGAACGGLKPALSCKDAERLTPGAVPNILPKNHARFKAVSVACSGVSTEQNSGTAKLTIVAEIEPYIEAGRGRAYDPLTVGGQNIPAGTRFEFISKGRFTHYDTGWQVDQLEVEDARRLAP